MDCRICNGKTEDPRKVKEWVQGKDEFFVYRRCISCHTIQLDDIPDDLSHYYGRDYYSHTPIQSADRYGRLKQALLIRRDRHALAVKPDLIGRLIQAIRPVQVSSLREIYKFIYLRVLNNKNARIHDIGCGNGKVLRYFNRLGFTGLSGNDPFLEKDILEDDLEIRACEFDKIPGNFDAVMLNHVLEHVRDPLRLLSEIRDKLSKNGQLLVRTPLAGSFGERTYGEHWSGYDAPRHLHIFTAKELKARALAAGLRCSLEAYDSVGWNYSVSEGYKNGIKLADQSFDDIVSFEALAQRLNKDSDGDSGVFIFTAE